MCQRNQRGAHSIFFCCVKSLRFFEPALRFFRSPQQHQCTATISLCARLFSTHSMFSKNWNYSFVDLERLGREVEFEICVGDVVLSQHRLNRKAQRGVALTCAFEKIQRSIVTTLEECEEPDTAFNSGESYRLAGCFGLL